ncbi:hypothetical protein EV356DRAFT_15838 [Viridothelium virens]|uniref:Uncharacterized protein n=1 Tax=Viridothelium virens TaxID=1048519 RepID=A0A6A6HH54_VIRVR|nr:hypothetical protein EV356DRAFT_15838 [Viridothelium virens]
MHFIPSNAVPFTSFPAFSSPSISTRLYTGTSPPPYCIVGSSIGIYIAPKFTFRALSLFNPFVSPLEPSQVFRISSSKSKNRSTSLSTPLSHSSNLRSNPTTLSDNPLTITNTHPTPSTPLTPLIHSPHPIPSTPPPPNPPCPPATPAPAGRLLAPPTASVAAAPPPSRRIR